MPWRCAAWGCTSSSQSWWRSRLQPMQIDEYGQLQGLGSTLATDTCSLSSQPADTYRRPRTPRCSDGAAAYASIRTKYINYASFLKTQDSVQ